MLKFDVIVLGQPAGEYRKAANDFRDKILYGGLELIQNHRGVVRVVGDPGVPGRMTWEMKVGNPEEKGTSFQVIESVNDIINWPADSVVLVIEFGGQKRQLQLKVVSERVYTLLIPKYVKATYLPRLANQIVADLIVNGRLEPYLNGGTGKKSRGISHRTRGHRTEQHGTI